MRRCRARNDSVPLRGSRPWRGPPQTSTSRLYGADDGIRTRDPHLGKVMRYQLRYIRVPGRCGRAIENFSRPVGRYKIAWSAGYGRGGRSSPDAARLAWRSAISAASSALASSRVGALPPSRAGTQ